MARVAVPVTQITRAGVAPPTEVDGDVVNNHSVRNDGKVWVLARNSNGGSTARTVTFKVSKLVDGQTVSSTARSIAAGASKYFGPFPVKDYGTTLEIDVSNAEVKLSAFRV